MKKKNQNKTTSKETKLPAIQSNLQRGSLKQNNINIYFNLFKK